MSAEKITLKSLNDKINELKADMEVAGVKKRKQGNWLQRLNAWRNSTCLDEMLFVFVGTTLLVGFLASRSIWPFTW